MGYGIDKLIQGVIDISGGVAIRIGDGGLIAVIVRGTGYDMFQVDWFCESEFGFAQGICYAYATGYGTN